MSAAVLLHNGQIDVTSELNQGTSFIVSLPADVANSKVSRHTPFLPIQR